MKIEFETLADIAADTTLADSDIVKHPDRPGWSTTVGALRALEGRRHSEKDQAALDAAGVKTLGVLDHLRQAGARLPGTSQTAEADLEKVERAAERYIAPAPPDPFQRDIAAMRAASATPPSFEDGWKETRAQQLASERERMTAHVAAHPRRPRLTAAETKSYAPPNPFSEAALDKLRSGR